MKKSDYTISDIYQGGYSSFDSSNSLSPSNYPVLAGSMGVTTDPRTANVLKEVSAKLSTGVKQIELEAVSPEIFEAMPQDQLKEVNRLAKLTGVDMSVHGPVVDSAGITQQGFSEQNREAAERRFVQTIERSHDIDPDGNILVNFHSAEGIPGSEFEWDKDGKRTAKKLIVINRETGKPAPLEGDKRHYPEMSTEELKEGRPMDTIRELKSLNATEWDNSVSGAVFNNASADRILSQTPPIAQQLAVGLATKKIIPSDLPLEQRDVVNKVYNAMAYLDQAEKTANSLFNKAYKYGNSDQQKQLENLSEAYKQQLGMINANGKYSEEELTKIHNPKNKQRAMQFLLGGLQNVIPEMYIPIEEFAINQSSKTFGNTAFEGYKKFGDSAPVVAIENPPAGFALSTGEDLRKLVEKSREQFIEVAKKEGMSESRAKKQAEKLIGATWDVGHINMIRKSGGTKEDLLRETETIKPLVKHVHLSDNFGFEHTELPMGMGNVPIKEMMGKLGKEGFEAKKIIEAASWFQHFQSAPIQQSFEAFGSPIYSMQMAPYWNQSTGLQQGYHSGMGMVLPDINFQTFGAGFSQLPNELGGQQQGAKGSRVSGQPME